MGDSGLLADRLTWARREQGMTLHQLSERSGRAVSYLSQLEHGVRTNPTKQTVEVLATALGVRPAFLLEQGQEPAGAAGVAVRFRTHVEGLSPAAREQLAYATPSERFCVLASFLTEQCAENITPLEMAYQLGMSNGQYTDILCRGAEVSHYYLEQLARVTGVPLSFLTLGTFEAPQPPATDLAAEALRYLAVIHLAQEQGLSPERLKELILASK